MRTGVVVAVMLSVTLGLSGAAATAGPTSTVSPELLDTAIARGTVRVIVMLKVPAGADPAAIEVTKQLLWIDLTGTAYRILRDLPAFEVVVLEASPDALRALESSAHVEHVSEDSPRPPQR